MRRPNGSYLKATVPLVPGRVTLVRRFSKSHVYVAVPVESAFVSALPLMSEVYVVFGVEVSSFDTLLLYDDTPSKAGSRIDSTTARS